MLLGRRAAAALVRGRIDKTLVIDTLLPADPGRFSWGGHLGAQMQQPVVEEIERSATTLVFTNMRSQAEIWYQLLLEARPEWAGAGRAAPRLARPARCASGSSSGLKEGRAEGGGRDLVARPRRRLPAGRARAADRLGQGRRAAAAARRPQRPRAGPAEPRHAGADQHARARRGRRRARARRTPAASRSARRRDKPLDVLVQHLVTVALGGGFAADDAVRRGAQRAGPTASSTRDEFEWALDFVEQRRRRASRPIPSTTASCRTTTASTACPTAASRGATGCSVGTIVSDAAMQVKYLTRRAASARSRRASSRA